MAKNTQRLAADSGVEHATNRFVLGGHMAEDADSSRAEDFIRSLGSTPLRDGTHIRAVAAARQVVEQAEATLVDSIRVALAAGDSWTMIGLALRTSKQNAHRKYAPMVGDTADSADECEHERDLLKSISASMRSIQRLVVLTNYTEREGVNMANNNDRHVVPSERGGWDVVKPGATRASSHHDTQADAINRGRDIVRNAGGGELNIHGRNGQIREKDTIPDGNDPRTSKG